VNTWKVILATVIIFIAGAITGGLVVRNSRNAKIPAVIKPENGHAASTAVQNTNATRQFKLPPPLMGPLARNFVDRLQRELNIDAGQRERIERIICDGQETTRLIWQEIEPDIHHTLVETKDKIRCELTPEQLAKFEELFKMKPKPVPSTNATPAVVTNTVPSQP